MDQTSVPRRRSFLPTRCFPSSSVAHVGSRRRTSSGDSASFGELCGGATAECTAICCCFPLAITNFLVLAIYKIPAGLCRRAFHRMRLRKLQKEELIQPCNEQGHDGWENSCFPIHAGDSAEEFFPAVEGCEEAEKEAEELEKKMWQKFIGTGFWRSPSQREGDSTKSK
ncbi:hypothetical protein like AT3G11690 [Hibiscus trionum]|uniref:Pollen preferential protein n=1 Tax=Hibiscus trionum TaxID=183268 RepID=A0A9W7JEH7_HIBTR|nr:hypothetical protein like AT3G11690 [Hibiscus trionum]